MIQLKPLGLLLDTLGVRNLVLALAALSANTQLLSGVLLAHLCLTKSLELTPHFIELVLEVHILNGIHTRISCWGDNIRDTLMRGPTLPKVIRIARLGETLIRLSPQVFYFISGLSFGRIRKIIQFFVFIIFFQGR